MLARLEIEEMRYWLLMAPCVAASVLSVTCTYLLAILLRPFRADLADGLNSK